MGAHRPALRHGPIEVEADVDDSIYIRDGDDCIRGKIKRVVAVSHNGVYVSYQGGRYFVAEADYTPSKRQR